MFQQTVYKCLNTKSVIFDSQENVENEMASEQSIRVKEVSETEEK